MAFSAPTITIYSRVIDNITKEEISGFQPVNSKSKFGFGAINGISGGESPVIIEFDIWNNEPAFGGGFSAVTTEDAVNCKFTAWDSNECISSSKISAPSDVDIHRTPYIRSRCVTIDNHTQFVPIGGARYLPAGEMINSVNNSSGILLGQPGGDHMKIQTKIVIPRNTTNGVNNFVFEFSYDYV